MINFQFLGTGSALPTRVRNVAAMTMNFAQGKENFLFDCGEGTQHRLNHPKSLYSIAKLSHIFITHLHGDHCYGLYGLLSTRMALGATAPLYLYGPKGIKNFIKYGLQYSYCTLKYPLYIKEFEKEETILNTPQYTIKIISLEHNVPSYGFLIEEKKDFYEFNIKKALFHKLPEGPLYRKLVQGKNIEHNKKKYFSKDFLTLKSPRRRILICGDNANPQNIEHIKDLDLLIHESTHTEEVKKKLSFQSYHSTAQEIGITARNSSVKNLILNHFSPRFSLSNQEEINMTLIKQEVKEHYSKALYLAQDFDYYQLDKKAQLTLKYKK